MWIRRPVILLGVCWTVVLTSGLVAEEADGLEESSLKIDDEHLMELDTKRGSGAEGLDADSDRDAVEERNDYAIDRLIAENEILRKKVLALKREMSKLSLSFSAYKSKTRHLRRNERAEGGESRLDSADGYAGNVQTAAVVLDADRDLELVALGAGSEEGLRPGLRYRITRRGRVIASVRLVLVRESVSAAKVLDEGREKFPGAGDRAVLGRATKRSD